MELLFNYYHGLLTQQKNTNNINNNMNMNMNISNQYNEAQHVITPELFTQVFTLLASLNYLEQFKLQENIFTTTTTTPINQSIEATSPYQTSLGSTRYGDTLVPIKYELDKTNCVRNIF
jgi:hypothetical protein